MPLKSLARLFYTIMVNSKDMKYFFLNIMVAGMMVSCATGTESKENEPGKDLTAPKTAEQTLTGCYRMIIEKDTAELKLDINGSIVKGSLLYNRFEKDDNNGELNGVIENNVIKAWYRYRSESLVSVKEVYFKIQGDKLEEGYGDIAMRGDSTSITHDTAYFKYPATLQYESNHPYIKINCN